MQYTSNFETFENNFGTPITYIPLIATGAEIDHGENQWNELGNFILGVVPVYLVEHHDHDWNLSQHFQALLAPWQQSVLKNWHQPKFSLKFCLNFQVKVGILDTCYGQGSYTVPTCYKLVLKLQKIQ